MSDPALSGSARRAIIETLRSKLVRVPACAGDDDDLIDDSFHVDTVLLRLLHVAFFIELDTCRVFVTGVTANPVGDWVTGRARTLRFVLAEQDSRRSS